MAVDYFHGRLPVPNSRYIGTYPAHEHEMFTEHFSGLLALWVQDETHRLR